MEHYKKRGFLDESFQLFHIRDSSGDKISVEKLDYHYHDFNKIYLLLNGNVTYNIEGKSYPLLPYDIVLVGKNELHKPVVDFSVPYERIILYTHLPCKDLLYYCFSHAKEASQPIIRIKELSTTRLYQTLLDLEASIRSADFGDEIYQEALYREFLVLLNRSILHKECCSVSPGYAGSRMHRLLAYISENLQHDLSIDTISAHFYISKYHLMRSFKAETGYSLHDYIVTKRLLLAKELLAQDYSMGEVCFQCGFQDYSTFYRAFKKKYSMSPAAYIKQP